MGKLTAKVKNARGKAEAKTEVGRQQGRGQDQEGQPQDGPARSTGRSDADRIRHRSVARGRAHGPSPWRARRGTTRGHPT